MFLELYWLNILLDQLLNLIFVKDLAMFYFIIKFHGTINDPLPVLQGNKQDLDYENIVNTCLFYQVCKVHDIVCFGDQFASAEKSWYLNFRHFCLKLVSQLNFC